MNRQGNRQVLSCQKEKGERHTEMLERERANRTCNVVTITHNVFFKDAQPVLLRKM